MHCVFCGHWAVDDSATCRHCGRALAPPAHAGEVTELSRPPSQVTASDLVTASSERLVDDRGAPTDGLLHVGEIIGDRYRVVRLINRGGMGAVYEAWDAWLGVPAAIKILLAQHSDDPVLHQETDRRIKKELLVARKITHKNVVRIHDIGDLRGMKFISMSYIDGEDLATIVNRGPMPVPQALDLARQIASGLAAAHEAGVIHRDLKPGNIMVERSGAALLTDFGIARLVRPASGPISTTTGTLSGTIDYMAPEQARAEVVDGRADIYAFGLILYEMLSGRRRLSRDAALADLLDRMGAPPISVRTLQPGVPEALDAVVTKCLQPHAADRYATSADLLAALEVLDGRGNPRPAPRLPAVKFALPAAVALVIGAAALTGVIVGRPPEAPVAHDPVSLLIADFDNQAKDPVFEGTLESALLVAMEGAPFVTAFPRSTARSIHAQLRPRARFDEEGARLVSQREGIRIVLAGAISLDDEEYRLTVRAVDSVAGATTATAAATADSKSEVLAAVNRVAAQLREALGDTIAESGNLPAAETFTASSLEAAQAYSRGQELFYAAKREEAIEQYRAALRHDPNMGRAYAGWALAAAVLGRTEEAEAMYKEAFARLDRMTEREKLITLGHYYNRVARNPEKAIETFSQLVQKYPADASALNNLAVSHFRALHFADALEHGNRLVSVYPEQVQWRYNYALYAMYAGEFPLAREQAEEALKRNPDTPKAYLAIAMSALAGGNVTESRQVWERAVRSGLHGASLAASGLADLMLYQGRPGDVVPTLGAAIEADRKAKNTVGSASKLIILAEAHQMSGNVGDAVALAQQALKISNAESVIVPAARILLAGNRRPEGRALATDLGTRLSVQARAYGKLIDAESARLDGRTVEAVETLRTGVRLADLWLLRYALGVAYVHANAFPEALSELEACEKRRGEATSVFLNDEPSWRYMVPLTYWLARARDGVGLKTQAMEGYKTFVALRSSNPQDPLVADARQRAGL